MKILHVADLHNEHQWLDWVASCCVEYDLLVIAGDLQNAFSNMPMREQARQLTSWLRSLPVPTVACSGNHDYWVSDPRVSHDTAAEGRWLRLAKATGNVMGVDGDVVDHGGLKIAVNGWLKVPDLRDVVDVLVTHAPPMGCACASGAEGHDNGDPELFPAVQYNPLTLILAGHIHAPRKHVCSWPPLDSTTLVLVPGCDENAEVPNHWIIDTSAGSARHSSGEAVAYD